MTIKVANPTPFDTVLRKILRTTQKTMMISEIRASEFENILETTGSDMQPFITTHCYGASITNLANRIDHDHN